MGDRLKQFIDDNRESFDSEDPSPSLYQSVQQRLAGNRQDQKKSANRLFRFAAVAASVIIVSVSLYFIFQDKPGPPRQNQPAAADDYNATYVKQIDQYKLLIDKQQTQLKQVALEHPDLYQQFSDDINLLDSAYRSLKITLNENPNTEMLLEAMIHNLRLQTELLNQQLSIIKEIKQKSKA